MAPSAGIEAAEREQVIELARAVASETLWPRSGALDAGRPGAFEECWSKLAEAGLDCALPPDADDGGGVDPGTFLAALSELAAGDAGIALSVLLANLARAAMPPPLPAGAGERWSAVLTPSEPGAGAGRPQVAISGAGARVHGHLGPVPGAAGAAGLVLVGWGRPPVALRASEAGLEVRPAAQMGLGGAPAAELVFESVAGSVAEGGWLDGDGATALAHGGIAAIARGISRRAYAIASEYAATRQQGGGPILDHGAVRELLGGMAERLRASPSGGGEPEVRRALAERLRDTEAACATATDAVQVLGGAGYMQDSGVEKLMRDARYCRMLPDPEWVSRELLLRAELGEPAPRLPGGG